MTWPRRYHPIVGGAPDTTTALEMYPHTPDGTDALAQWCDVNGTPTERIVVNGGPALLLTTDRPFLQRLVGLGDVVARPAQDVMFAIPGGELSGNYEPADLAEPPPVD